MFKENHHIYSNYSTHFPELYRNSVFPKSVTELESDARVPLGPLVNGHFSREEPKKPVLLILEIIPWCRSFWACFRLKWVGFGITVYSGLFKLNYDLWRKGLDQRLVKKVWITFMWGPWTAVAGVALSSPSQRAGRSACSVGVPQWKLELKLLREPGIFLTHGLPRFLMKGTKRLHFSPLKLK